MAFFSLRGRRLLVWLKAMARAMEDAVKQIEIVFNIYFFIQGAGVVRL